MGADRDLFAEAKRVPCAEIAQAAGVKLRRASGRLIGACPLCGGDAKSTRFGVNLANNLWVCRACGEGGSAIDLDMALHGGAPLDAARRLVGEIAAGSFTRAPVNAAPVKPRSTAPMAARLWREAATPAHLSNAANAWFAGRGLDPAAIAQALARLKFHPDAFAAGERINGRWVWLRKAPAILAPIIDTANQGRIIGVHATYLTKDGRDKALMFAPNGDQVPARKMWGKHQGGVVALTTLRPTNPLDSEIDAHDSMIGRGAPLFVGEGLETTLSALAYWRARHEFIRAAAALSLDNLQGHWLKDDEGCAVQWPPRADPARAPWTLPDAGHVVAIIDRDMSGIYVKRRDDQGQAKRVLLNGEARAQICADLVTQAWRRAGAASIACALPLNVGADLNDMARNEISKEHSQ